MRAAPAGTILSLVTPEEAYRILEVAPGAGAAAVQEAYRKAALREHPDRAQGYGLHDRKEWLRVRDAYECLRAAGFPSVAAAQPAPPPEPKPKRYRAPEWLERQWANQKPEDLSANLKLDDHESRALVKLLIWLALLCGSAYLVYLWHAKHQAPRSLSPASGWTVSW